MLKWVWVSILVFFTDQLTKWIAEANLEEHVPHAVFNHLNMMLSYNFGAAFSSFSGFRWLLAGLSIVVSIFILYWMRKLKNNETWTAIGLALVLGGAIGNLADRLLNGKVIDFIDVYWTETGYHFATFNVADIAITTGAALLVFISLLDKREDG